MNAAHLNAFIDATKETLESMCQITALRRVDTVKKVSGEIVDSDELMAIVGLTGDAKGAVLLSTPLITGMKIVSKFVMEELTEINCDLMDGFGEIVNIIAGAADAKIDDLNMFLSLPSILIGNNSKFYAKAGNPFIMVPMYINEMGNFNLGVSMEIVKK